MPFGIRLVGTPVGQYVVDVEQRGSGRCLVVSDDPAQARRWADPAAARRFWADDGLPTDVPFGIDLLPQAGAEVCDFCSAPDPVWLYPARAFEVTAYAWGSRGGWASCAGCTDLIERGDWGPLAERAVDSNPCLPEVSGSTAHALAIEAARQLHAVFRQARTGAARRPLRPD
ncbi:MAG: hypothetical protein JOZ87_03590 [Chloroflexi bacterium]|nr:hypothetical protein [Chloroflexota bacterium]